MKTNQNKVAIVTGSSRGIGAAVAKRLALDGFAVVVNSAGRAADEEKVAQEIGTAGGQAITVKADVSIPAEMATLFDKTEEAFGGVDVIVNNAGVMQPGLVPLADTWCPRAMLLRLEKHLLSLNSDLGKNHVM
jgi:3-oxoacyl-[acyl-carrier protein] reductase